MCFTWSVRVCSKNTGSVVRIRPYFQDVSFVIFVTMFVAYLTIIPRARMGSESIAHEAEGRMGSNDSEAMRARGIIALVKSN